MNKTVLKNKIKYRSFEMKGKNEKYWRLYSNFNISFMCNQRLYKKNVTLLYLQ